MSKILVVDDEPRILLLMKSLLKANGHEIETTGDGQTALARVKAAHFDIVLTDLRMTPMDGLQLHAEIKKLYPDLPVILLTAYASVETAIEAMKNGVFDYLTKPFKVDDLSACIKRAEEKVRKSVVARDALTGRGTPDYQLGNMIAAAPSMRFVCETIRKVAPTATTVLINGESGTGKEVVARTIHNLSARANKPWVAINCAAIPENLLESELFGHQKGSFTGAVADKEGLFEVANGGTIFLDEISSMPLILQGKLLRVLQEREIRRVGGTRDIPIDVRVIAATNANLEEAVVKGTFRSDLYYRFAVVTIDLPPLRKRVEDILPLARHFLYVETKDRRDMPTFSEETAQRLQSYAWPGNVRELENAVKHVLTFLQGNEITPDLLPPKIAEHVPAAEAATSIAASTSLKSFLKAKEKEYIGQILTENGGDKEKTAEALQVNLSTLYRKLGE